MFDSECNITYYCAKYSGICWYITLFSITRPKKNPLFLVDLVLDQTEVHYSTPLEKFETSIVNLFDKGILATYNVPQLDKVKYNLQSPESQSIKLKMEM